MKARPSPTIARSRRSAHGRAATLNGRLRRAIACRAALHTAGALLVLTSVTACEGVNHKSCRNGDCTVVVVDAQWSGDLAESGNTGYEFEVYMSEDQSAEVIVEQEEGNREEEQTATLRPGESAELFHYTVEYVSQTEEEGATFQFTPS